MAAKMTGAEWKAFYTDDDVWKEGSWHDELVLKINGTPYADDGDEYWKSLAYIDLVEGIEDNAAITLIGGTLYCGDDDARTKKSLLDTFKKWRKARGVITLAVSVPAEKLEDVKAAICSAGGKVL